MLCKFHSASSNIILVLYNRATHFIIDLQPKFYILFIFLWKQPLFNQIYTQKLFETCMLLEYTILILLGVTD